MQTDESIKKRDPADRDDTPEVQKRFKSNMEPIEQISEKQLTQPHLKNQFSEPQKTTLPLAYTRKQMDFKKYIKQKAFVELNSRKTVVLDKRRVDALQPQI